MSSCGLAIIALVFSIITLVFEALGVILSVLNLLLPDKTIVLPFSKWFVVAHIGVYFGTVIFYVLHFFIRKYTFDGTKVDENKRAWNGVAYCFFGIDSKNKDWAADKYKYGNGYSVYWGHIFLFIIGIVGIVISIFYLLPLKIKIFGLLYVIVGFVHIFIVWVVFLSVSVPSLNGERSPGFDGGKNWDWCWGTPFNGNWVWGYTGFCNPYGFYHGYNDDYGCGGCSNGYRHSSRNYNFLYVISKKFYDYGSDPKKELRFHRNNYRPWFFSYELVFFIVMSVFYVGFVLVNFEIDFKGSLLNK